MYLRSAIISMFDVLLFIFIQSFQHLLCMPTTAAHKSPALAHAVTTSHAEKWIRAGEKRFSATNMVRRFPQNGNSYFVSPVVKRQALSAKALGKKLSVKVKLRQPTTLLHDALINWLISSSWSNLVG